METLKHGQNLACIACVGHARGAKTAMFPPFSWLFCRATPCNAHKTLHPSAQALMIHVLTGSCTEMSSTKSLCDVWRAAPLSWPISASFWTAAGLMLRHMAQ